MKTRTYWAIVVPLIVFGWLGLFSIGAPFLLIGLMLAVLSPWRARRGVIPTGIAVVVGFVVGYVLVAPLGCTATAVPLGGSQVLGSTTCSNLLGITYEGSGNYNPSLLPGLLAGVGLAGITGVTTGLICRRHLRHRPPSDRDGRRPTASV